MPESQSSALASSSKIITSSRPCACRSVTMTFQKLVPITALARTYGRLLSASRLRAAAAEADPVFLDTLL